MKEDGFGRSRVGTGVVGELGVTVLMELWNRHKFQTPKS
jgi:hypothetical protein